ncbi:MAG: hypothetical protein AAF684_09935, partial [Pseudomonadota bacterium]
TLANQTAKATEEISGQIKAVQDQTDGAVRGIEDVGQRIQRIEDIAAAVAAAVTQQDAATSDISRNAQMASAATGRVSTAIAELSASATQVGQSADGVTATAGDVGAATTDLRNRIAGFLDSVRAA